MMYKKYLTFPGKIIIVGFGSIGQAILPLIFRHIKLKPEQVTVITKDTFGRNDIAEEYGVTIEVASITRENYQAILSNQLRVGDFLLNLSVDVSSIALIKFCQEKGVLYLDTCIEPWEGGYRDSSLPLSERSNYALRESALALRRQLAYRPTALVTHGANPGLVSHFVKQALLNIAGDLELSVSTPRTRLQWAKLAHDLSIKTIHIAERDTQITRYPKRSGEFVNTWSIAGFVGEGSQPAELGWGSHERHFPSDGARHNFGCQSAIYLNRPGASTRVRTWTPLAGSFHGFLITHGESISIADYLTVMVDGRLEYRPTVHYAYHPCEDAVLSIHEFAGNEWQEQPNRRLLSSDIIEGTDELGALLMGHRKGAYWFGSQLSIEEARRLAPHNTATSLQVAIGVLAGLIWVIEHPEAGIVEPDEVPYTHIMRIATPYLGKVIGCYTDWTPLEKRGKLFQETLDETDPWQFLNVRVG